MISLKFRIAKNSCKTEAQFIYSSKCRMRGFTSDLKDLAIILEDKGSKSIYYALSTKKGFRKDDPLEFRKIWLEYKQSDQDYDVVMLVG